MNISWRMLLKQDYGMQRGKKNYFLSGADRLENLIATSLVGNLWLFFPCSSLKVCFINLVSFLSSELQHFTFFYSLLQLDANLIEGEPYNHLAWKNKRQSGATKFKYIRNVGNRFQNLPKQTASLWIQVQCGQHRDFLRPPAHLWAKKHHLLTLNTKLTLQLTIWMALVQDVRLTTKKCVCTVKDLYTTSKSINKIRPVLMP